MEGHIYIYGEIIAYQGDDAEQYGMVSPKNVLNQLKSVDSAESLTVHINSNGGDVDAGFAIYDILKASGKQITTIMEGQCYSIATVPLMAGSVRLATSNSSLLIHNPWTMDVGEAKQLRKTADDLEKMEAKMANFYATTTGSLSIDNARLEMDKNEVMSLERAKEMGFITDIIDTLKAVAKINTQIKQVMAEEKEVIHAPKGFMDKLNGLFNGGHNRAKALVVKTATDEDVDFFELEDGEPALGDKATVAGEQAEGDVLMSDGRTFTFEGGELVSIDDAVEDVPADEQMVAMQAEIDRLTEELSGVSAMKQEIATMQASMKEHAKTFKGLKALVSGVAVEDKQKQKSKEEPTSIFGDAFKTK